MHVLHFLMVLSATRASTGSGGTTLNDRSPQFFFHLHFGLLIT
jgi:hypothetical protein